MAELAVGYVSILPETSKIAPGVRKAFRGVDSMGAKVGQSMGSRIASGLSTTLKVGAASAGAAAAGVLGAAVAKGFSRMNATANAEAKLLALGNSAADVAGVMDNALASVKGTAFGIGEAAGTAATMVASGIKPGQELETVLKGVADTAAVAGTGMDEMGLIFGKVAAKGKLDGEVVAQLMERQLPIYDIISQKTGVVAADVAEMVSEGKVDFQTFSEAMNEYVGGGALKMADTVDGAMENMTAAMGRMGEQLTQPLYDAAPALLTATGTMFDGVVDAIKPASAQIGEILTPALTDVATIMETSLTPRVADVAARFGELAVSAAEFVVDPATWQAAADIFAAIWEKVELLRPSFEALWPSVVSLAQSFAQIGASIGVGVWQAFGSVLQALVPVVEGVLVPMVEQIARFAEANPGTVQAIVGAFLGFKAIGTIVGPATAVFNTLNNVGGAVSFLGKAFQGGGLASGLVNIMGAFKSANPIIASMASKVTTLTKVLAVVGRVVRPLVNIAATAIRFINPWVAGITLIAGALGWFFTQTETGKNIVSGFVELVAAGWQRIVDGWNALSAAVVGIWENNIRPVLETIASVAQHIVGIILAAVIAPLIIAWNGLSALFKATWENIIRPTWNALSSFATNTLLPMLKGAFDKIKAVWDGLASGIQWAWENIIKVAWNALQQAAQWLWANALQPVFNAIGNAWNTMAGVLRAGWEFINNNVFAPLRAGVQAVASWVGEKIAQIVGVWDRMREALHAGWVWISSKVLDAFRRAMEKFRTFFDSIVDGIGRAWNGLRSKLAKPVNFLINVVYNDGILRAWNTIADILPALKPGERLTGIPEHAKGPDPC